MHGWPARGSGCELRDRDKIRIVKLIVSTLVSDIFTRIVMHLSGQDFN